MSNEATPYLYRPLAHFGGQTIKDAIDALRSDDAANSSMPTDGTDNAGAQA